MARIDTGNAVQRRQFAGIDGFELQSVGHETGNLHLRNFMDGVGRANGTDIALHCSSISKFREFCLKTPQKSALPKCVKRVARGSASLLNEVLPAFSVRYLRPARLKFLSRIAFAPAGR